MRSAQITRTEYLAEVWFEIPADYPDYLPEPLPKRIRRGSMKLLERCLVRLGPEPWNADLPPGKDPDDPRCCLGGPEGECGCEGETFRENALAYRKQKFGERGISKIVRVKISTRKVTRTRWEPFLSVHPNG